MYHSYARSKSTVLVIAAPWLGLALIASLISIWFPIPTALSIGAGSRYYRHRGDPNDLPQHLLSEAGSSDLAKTRIPVLSKILYAHDGSEDGFRALTRALAIAKQNHAELMVSVEKPAGALIPKVARQNCCPRRHPRFKAQKRRRRFNAANRLLALAALQNRHAEPWRPENETTARRRALLPCNDCFSVISVWSNRVRWGQSASVAGKLGLAFQV